MENSKPVLKYLDNPIRIITFSLQEILLYSIPFMIGALFDSLFVVPVCGLVTILVFRRIFSKLPKFTLVRFLYWYFPTQRFNKLFRTKLPASNKRLYVR